MANSQKRKLPLQGLQRRVRPRQEEVPDEELDESLDDNDDQTEPDMSDDDLEGENVDDEDDDEDASESDGPPPARSKVDPSSISFGALAKAQASIPPLRKRQKRATSETRSEEDGDESDSDDARPKTSGPGKRSSKHAPMEMSSKRPVSRKREVIAVPKLEARDPRFDPLISGGGAGFNEAKAKKAYAFLDEYRDSEMTTLRAEIKKTKDPAEKEKMKRLLGSMENRKKAELRKDEERRILEEHRRQEKELVKQGKKPFYLKKSEQKKRLLVEQFKGMKKKQVDRVIERKRKKVAGREKKELDQLQRRR
ncbi:DUF947-domain-containing protein [Sodiomyces alkalinus F11]|uniref:rRNA biogenesis protein RRP36 n=1 Tax=Sodiomyces alkalinus (strain CBS 110278 / VKM F-3762 / F11) TaxID=1314773 RepID=A0A3N2Q259_SODAK|nr:DUF947-domain-containing protein [Sodiomyces alkalinus F11]ROT40822.1 DUF947-domain-containing protein [Sodiomyces alkalinus F11]